MKRLKRFAAIAAFSMLLCGSVCQAAGESGEEEPKIHVHAYSWIKEVCRRTYPESWHQYVVGTVTKPSGEVEYKYATCDVLLVYNADLYRCGCGDEYYENKEPVRRHMACGQ